MRFQDLRKTTLRIFVSVVLAAALFPLSTAALASFESDPASLSDFQQVAPARGWLLFDQRLYWTNNDGLEWRDITPPVQAKIETVTFLDNSEGRVILGGDAAYMLASTQDGGDSWALKSLNLPGLAEFPEPVGAVHMGWRDAAHGWLVFELATGSNFSRGLLFVTADGGATWQARAIPLGEPAYFVNEQLGWVAGGPAGDALYRTQDGGQTWQPVQVSSERVYYQLPVFENGQNGLLPVVTETLEAEFYATEDGGQTWTSAGRVPLGPNTSPEVDLPLARLGVSGLALVVPGTSQIVQMEAGEIVTRVNADGESAGIVRLSMSTPESGWAEWVSGECVRDGDGTICTQEKKLLGTSDGGEHWAAMTLPNTQASLHQSFSLADKADGSAKSETVSSLDADTQAYVGQGFDICEIRPLSQMQTWWNNSPYNAVNLYIGGSARACSNSILSASYLSQLNAQGWRFIPTWVGPQASCTGYSSRMSSDPAVAYNQGIAEANSALAVAANLGLTEANQSGTVIYYDLEAYDTGNGTCRAAANSFISGWTYQMQARGNLAGVYGASCASAPSDWASIANVPDALWVANWYANPGQVSYTRTATVWDAYCLSNSLWADHQRLRQYAGDHNETWGGLTLNIDSNVLDGPLTIPNGTAGVSAPGQPFNPGPSAGSTLERTNDTWLSWRSNGDTCSLHIWGGSIDITTAANCSLYHLGVRNGGLYSWQVTATNSVGSTVGPVWQFEIKPHGATSVTAAAASSTKVNVNWHLSADEPSNVDEYLVYADGAQVGSVGNGVSTYQVQNLACNSSHSFYVVAVRQGVNSNPSNTANAATASCAPVIISPSDGAILESKRPVFNWQAVDGATSYTLQASKYVNFSSLSLNATVTGTTYTAAADLVANTLYYWRVRAKGPFGTGDWSLTSSFITANPPGIPVLLSPGSNALVTDYTPRLDWRDVTLPLGTTLDHYQVQVASDLAFTAILYDEVVVLSEFTIPVELPPNAKYYWQVRAYNTLGQYSAWSAKRAFRAAILPPSLVSPLDATALLDRRPAFDWTDAEGASGYTLQVSRYANFSSVLKTVTYTTSAYTMTADLPANTVLYWRVRANGANGPSLWSPQVWSFVTGNPPGIPAPILPANGSLTTDYTPRLDWKNVTVPAGTIFDHYQIQVATDNTFTSLVLDETVPDVLVSEFTLATNLAPNTRYYWRVRSFNTAGHYSAWSAARNFRTAILPPALLTPVEGEILSNVRPPLDWEDVAGATNYTIQVSLSSTFSTKLVSKTALTSSYVPTVNLPVGVTLYWRVRANGANGPSLWSEVRSFTIQ
ncbi:MAG: glycoside hydrolase domain-containing protein [Chloroflexota bacterium]